ncbi:uncharacterized protein TNCV_4587581 [Trichonephila clavipes]|uniref:Uncharacterized protein n=1 Tax=Trichonephila clavipes TaxID=2585209 RepID=A0A8X6V3D2_TRICX|nr:uncharacterized protein TNCV_4587581 [Trichonephila clavipes]
MPTADARRWFVCQIFRSRHYSAVRSRLGARGTMTTTSYRSAAVGVRHLFSVEALLCSPVASWCTRNDDNDTYRGHSAVGVRPFFPSRQYSGVRLRLGARGTMITLYYRVRAAVGARHLFSIEALLCCPIVSCCTRNDDNEILPRTRDGGFSYHFFRRGTTLLSDRVLVHAERCQRHATASARQWVFVTIFRRGTTLRSGRVFVHAER